MLDVLQGDIAALYIKVGVKNIGTVFLHTDAQIPDERFLVLINDMLASGSPTHQHQTHKGALCGSTLTQRNGVTDPFTSSRTLLASRHAPPTNCNRASRRRSS